MSNNLFCQEDNYQVSSVSQSEIKKLINFPEIKPKLKELFYAGNINLLDTPIISIVGTRKPTGYGIKYATQITKELVNAGFTIASGLANGIDSVAHQAAIENNGKTIAVLPGGLDLNSIYPTNNHNLAKNIVKEQGLLLSEQTPGTPPLKHYFYLRNRLIASLGLATIVIESKAKGGALITSGFALELGKFIAALPGPIDKLENAGTNYLIKQGAHMYTNTEDFIEELRLSGLIKFNIQSQKNIETNQFTENEKILLDLLSNKSKYFEDMVTASKLNKTEALKALLHLENLKIIKQISPLIYSRIK